MGTAGGQLGERAKPGVRQQARAPAAPLCRCRCWRPAPLLAARGEMLDRRGGQEAEREALRSSPAGASHHGKLSCQHQVVGVHVVLVHGHWGRGGRREQQSEGTQAQHRGTGSPSRAARRERAAEWRATGHGALGVGTPHAERWRGPAGSLNGGREPCSSQSVAWRTTNKNGRCQAPRVGGPSPGACSRALGPRWR